MLGCERMQLSTLKRRRKKLSRYDWVPIQIYSSIYIADISIEETDQTKCTIFMGTRGENSLKKLKANNTSNDTMSFLDPWKQIVVQTEVSFHEGLSV